MGLVRKRGFRRRRSSQIFCASAHAVSFNYCWCSIEHSGAFMMWSNCSRKCMVAIVIAACVGGVASVARAELPAVPPDNQANYVPVAKRPRSEILAKGDSRMLRPDLTRGQLNDYRDLLGWILNIKFTEAQCDTYEQRMITRWPSFYSMDTDEITGASRQIADIKAMPPAQLKATYKSLHEQVLKNLRDVV